MSIPPIVGEYGYFDPRVDKNWVINVKDRGTDCFGCVYSSPIKKTHKYFITCQGIITNVICEVKNKTSLEK